MDGAIFIFVVVLVVLLFFGSRLLRHIMSRGIDEGINIVKRKMNEHNGTTIENLADRYQQVPLHKVTTDNSTEKLADQYKEKATQEQSIPQAEKEPSLFCKQCGAKLSSKDQKYCENCGSRIGSFEETPKKLFCMHCGVEDNMEATFCKNCGAPLNKMQTAKAQNTVQPGVNMEARKQEHPIKKKRIPKVAIILSVCVVVIGIAVVAVLVFRNNTALDKNAAAGSSSPSADEADNFQPTPFTEYLDLVGGDYKELYSDEYKIVEVGGAFGQYAAYTEIPFMDIDGTGSFQFYHAEDEETQSALEESEREDDTVLDFRWACDASVYSLDDVRVSFESIYGETPLHGVYSLGSHFDDRQVESYCWENIEGGYDMELTLEADGTAINAAWSVSPDAEGSYEDVVATLEKTLEEKDASTYESLLYKNEEEPSASDSAAEELAEIISGDEADKIDCYIGDTVKVTNTYFDIWMTELVTSGNYFITDSDMSQIKSLYFVNADLILYQNENIIVGASCKIDIAYIDDEWKILGLFRNERFSDTLLVEFVKQYYEVTTGNTPPNVEVDHYEGDNVVIHIYDISNNAISTWDWYTINPYTLEGTDFLGGEIRLYDAFNSER